MKKKLIPLMILAAIFLSSCTVQTCYGFFDFNMGKGLQLTNCQTIYTDGNTWPRYSLVRISNIVKR
jgi:hypothetical protein